MPVWRLWCASAIDSAVRRRDGRQVLGFGGLKQSSIVDGEGGEAVPMGVRGGQVYRIQRAWFGRWNPIIADRQSATCRPWGPMHVGKSSPLQRDWRFMLPSP